jgi:hypothetical protein
MKTGFIILNYNSATMTIKLARQIEKYSNIDSVLIVDNKSIDDSLKLIKNVLSDKIKVLESPQNGGYSSGNNLGLKYFSKLEFDIAIVANPDIYIDEDSINILLKAFQESDFSVLSPVEYDENWNMVKPPTIRRMNYRDDILDCFFVGRKLFVREQEIGLNAENGLQQTEMLRGSFLAFKLKDFQKIGYFDENIFLYCEERILSKKLQDANLKMGLVVNSKYQHNHMASIAKEYQSTVSKIKLLYISRLYYDCEYLKIGNFKYIFLKMAMTFSIFEYYVMDLIKKFKMGIDNARSRI